MKTFYRTDRRRNSTDIIKIKLCKEQFLRTGSRALIQRISPFSVNSMTFSLYVSNEILTKGRGAPPRKGIPVVRATKRGEKAWLT